MRIKIPGQPYEYVTACMWPRSRHARRGSAGGLVRACTTQEEHDRDIAEVRAYLKTNPGASISDVAMCCFMSNSHAERMLKKVRHEATA